MRYSEEMIEEVRAANPIVDVIGQYVHLQKKGGTHFGLCPFHGEKTPSFSVTPSKEMYYCFGCGRGGNVFTFLMEHENVSFPEALQVLADRAGITLPKEALSAIEEEKLSLRDKVLKANQDAALYFYSSLKQGHGQKGLEYFQNRGLTSETIRQFGLGFANNYKDDLYQYLSRKGYSEDILLEAGLILKSKGSGMYDRFWNRVMFPIMDVRSRVIGFGGRVLGTGEPKYLNSQETIVFDKGKNLYALNIAKKSKEDYFLICEGYMDVISLHQNGFDNAIATLGTALTTNQAQLISRYKKKVYFLYDSDGAGQRAMMRGIPILKEAGIQISVIDLGQYKDPDELMKGRGPEGLIEGIQRAIPAFTYEIRQIEKGYQLDRPDEKTLFIREVIRKLLEIEDELERENHLQEIARTYTIDVQLLKSTLAKMAMEGQVVRVQPMPLVTRRTKQEQRKEGIDQSLRHLLTWSIDDDKSREFIWKYLKPKDFGEGLIGDVAKEVYETRNQETQNIGMIMSRYHEPEVLQEVAKIFHSNLEVSSDEDRMKAIKETIIKVKQNSIEADRNKSRETDVQSLDKLRQLMEDKKLLEELKNSL